MIIAISQPTLFPWMGYFDIIKKSDVFVFLDIVKFEKRSWQMRNKIKTLENDEIEQWVNIPTKSGTNSIIKDVEIDNTQKWKEVHKKIFTSNYGKNFLEINFLDEIYSKDWKYLADFNIDFISKCCRYLDIKTNLIKASSLDVIGHKSQLLLNICKKLGAKKYLTTIGAREYLEKDIEIFRSKNIEIIYHNFIHPTYNQRGKKFIEYLSILDLIFNEKENSKKIFNY